MNADKRNEATDERFARDAQRLLRQGADELDAATLARLNRARRDALAEYDRRAGRRPAFGWQPALGAAAVFATAVIAVGLWIGGVPGPETSVPAAPVSATVDPAADLEVALGDDDNLEMIEDLEFYNWLDSDPAVDEPDPGRAG